MTEWFHIVRVADTAKYTVRAIRPGTVGDAPKDYDTEAECFAWIDGWTVRNEEDTDPDRPSNDGGLCPGSPYCSCGRGAGRSHNGPVR